MITATRTLPAALTLTLAAAACTTEETDPAVEVRSTTFGCSTCPPNSPRANDYAVDELSIEGLPNDDGVMVVGVRDKLNNLLKLDIDGDELLARDVQTNVVKAGPNLIGMRIELTDGFGATEYLHFFGYDSAIPSWADNTPVMTGYALAYKDPKTGRMRNVCPDYDNDPYVTAVTAIGGETYDGDTKSVEPAQAGWITLACEGQAVYKMKRLGYGPNIPFNGDPAPSTVAQRNATLKMITASYCAPDDSTSYTQQGTPIMWVNQAGNVDEWLPIATVKEAVWDENGPVCWNTHRVATIVPECDPVPCDATHVGEWTTWLPPP